MHHAYKNLRVPIEDTAEVVEKYIMIGTYSMRVKKCLSRRKFFDWYICYNKNYNVYCIDIYPYDCVDRSR